MNSRTTPTRKNWNGRVGEKKARSRAIKYSQRRELDSLDRKGPISKAGGRGRYSHPNRATGKCAIVYRHCPIILRQEEPNCVRLYHEEYSDSDDTTVTLGRFRELAKQAGVGGRIGPASCREIDADASVVIQKLWPSN